MARAGLFRRTSPLATGDSFSGRSSLARRGGSAFLSSTFKPVIRCDQGRIFERINAPGFIDRSGVSDTDSVPLMGLGLYVRLLPGWLFWAVGPGADAGYFPFICR